MPMFKALADLFHRGTRPPAVPGFAPAVPADADEDAAPAPAGAKPRPILFGHHLRGVGFAIEYRNASGKASRRRITILHLESNKGNGIIHAVCLETHDPKSFRIDRIAAIIDLDGEVHADVWGWLERTLRITPTMFRVGPPNPESQPGYAACKAAWPGINLLVALSRCDGFMHRAEIDVILEYIAERAGLEGIAFTSADAKEVQRYLDRQFPTPDMLAECLDMAEAEDRSLQKLFMKHASLLAYADGQFLEEEFRELLALQERLG